MSLNGRSLGGEARAKSLSPEKRSQIARNAADARWDENLERATHEGDFPIGETTLSSAILPSGKRIITQASFLRILGRSRSPKAGTGVLSTIDELPFFLQAEALTPFISNEVADAALPIFYRTLSGRKSVGYDARLLPKVAEVYLKYRDSCLVERGRIPARYEVMVRAADVLIRGLAGVGIIALVDEATGYQRDRAKDSLLKILDEFIAKELRPWVHTFESDFYEQLYRLRGLPYPPETVNKPSYFGHLTNSIVYERLAPYVKEALKKEIPKDSKGRPKHRLFRRLSGIGYQKLREHLASVITIMKLSVDYEQFEKTLDQLHPKFNASIPLPLELPVNQNVSKTRRSQP